MPFDLEKVIESKQQMRRKIAACPIAEKLEMLDTLRERSLMLRAAKISEDRNSVICVKKTCKTSSFIVH